MKYLMKNWHSDEYPQGAEYARVSITKDLAKRIMGRAMKLKAFAATDKELFMMEFWDKSCEFFDEAAILKALTAKEVEELLEENIIQIDKVLDTTCLSNVETERMIINRAGVSWEVNQKHSGIIVTTAEITFDEVEKSLR